MYEAKDIMVSHPPHYQSETGMEVIDVIEAFTFNLRGIEATDTGNIIKYICRWKEKNGVQDLEKAMWYLQHLIDHVKKLEEENKYSTTSISSMTSISSGTNMGIDGEPLSDGSYNSEYGIARAKAVVSRLKGV